ncbi:hypothetical protein FOC52_13595 (plasmid) [Staphylococcus cohnii]|nr:hypothetical protein FOC52_13595 [Staphylococcus cohnii]
MDILIDVTTALVFMVAGITIYIPIKLKLDNRKIGRTNKFYFCIIFTKGIKNNIVGCNYMVHGSVDKYFKEIQKGRDRQNNLSKEFRNKAKSHVITLDQHKQLQELKERQNNYNIYPTVQSDNYFIDIPTLKKMSSI